MIVAEQGKHTEGLLGSEGHVEPDPHGGWAPSFKELGEVLSGHEPLTAGPTMSDEVCLAWAPAGLDGPFDVAGMVLVVLGQLADVLVVTPASRAASLTRTYPSQRNGSVAANILLDVRKR